MAEWTVGPVMEKLIYSCFEYLKDRKGMKEELERLQLIHPLIQDLVSAWNNVEIDDPFINKWFWELRDAVDEADDVVDEFEYWKLEKQVNKNKKKIRKVRSLIIALWKNIVLNRRCALKVNPSLKKLEVAVKKLHIISSEVSTFKHLLEIKVEQQQLELHATRETGSLPISKLVGRSKEMEILWQWLLFQPDQEQVTYSSIDRYRNISLLSVVGLGGIGKTCLLQTVFQDEMTKEYFDVKIWVRVSNNFDEKEVIKNILNFFQKRMFDYDLLESLQRCLQAEVMSKRFLLVLDDIWEDDETKWNNVLAPLTYGNLGSKIMITTRMLSVSLALGNVIKNNKTLALKGLEKEYSLMLLNSYAFAGVENPNDELKSIAETIVNKLSGVPLAIKVIGSILTTNMDESYWRKFLNTNVSRSLEPGQNHLLHILKLSYIYLPKPLKNCFAFCCVFPEGHEFDRNDLVRMWIALDFVQLPNNSRETIEEIGISYFNNLVSRSFFDESSIDGKAVYRVHDLLYELAQFVFRHECFRVEDNKELPIPETIRYLSINTRSLETFKEMGEFKNLRSLFLSCNLECEENFWDVLSKIFKNWKSIRLLFISTPKLPKIPETIDSLIHLRYLKLDCSVSKLPMSLSHLHHLQFMIYKEIHNFEEDNFTNQNFPNLIHLIKL